jgi:two-component system OmpR family response regulator
VERRHGVCTDIADTSGYTTGSSMGPPIPNLRVLCVDDDPDTADSLAMLLELVGFDPFVYYDAKAALAAVDAIRPDAAILDLRMPGLHGCELARRLREWAGDRPLPLVAVTAQSDDEARRQTAEAGFDIHLTKPIDPDKLALVVADIVILRGDRAGDSGRLKAPSDPAR